MNALVRDFPTIEKSGGLHPGKLWSLWDIMINYDVFGLVHLLDQLRGIEMDFEIRLSFTDAALRAGGEKELQESSIPLEVSAADRAAIAGWLNYATRQADILELQAVHDRVALFRRRLEGAISVRDFHSEVRTLREAFYSGLQFKRFYKYPEAKASLLLRVDADWAAVNGKLPLVMPHVRAAIDCYALEHNAACVFHLMLAMEIGVRKFGTKLKVPLIQSTKKGKLIELAWGQILAEVKKRIDAMSVTNTRQKTTHERYSAVFAHLSAVGVAWRNPTMHPRSSGYNDLEALNIINHVRPYMTDLVGLFGRP